MTSGSRFESAQVLLVTEKAAVTVLPTVATSGSVGWRWNQSNGCGTRRTSGENRNARSSNPVAGQRQMPADIIAKR